MIPNYKSKIKNNKRKTKHVDKRNAYVHAHIKKKQSGINPKYGDQYFQSQGMPQSRPYCSMQQSVEAGSQKVFGDEHVHFDEQLVCPGLGSWYKCVEAVRFYWER